ncbi:MAG: methionine synthase [Candidatus Handelsmanbacteria bacterium RIFCSPLOWO2_12_FULL_64_10]|uniref:Methionine synthase n=1 Tax=Handelsmanbacteria sp. (strain RIFCSPLOWO2_12_FULL_64_10) TaxID=1817868 RepID=A0A1F6CBB0_HANXR|nr:MAG: methionine synthase [Candidatus Handelsmanbacteria bacterium RIFCSPLOWO2_12_FULL_64_10]
MSAPQILTTVVGSYPVPDWLRAYPTKQSLIDATMVVLKTQEEAGIDVVADGELYRFDVNHPETNGMIDYFIRPMSGITSEVSRETLEAFRRESGLAYRAEPAGVVEGPVGEGMLNLPRAYALVRPLTRARLKFTVTGPHMLSKVLMDRHYGDRARLADAIAEVLARQVAEIDADVVQVDEANIPGHPEEADWAAAAINRVLDAVKGEKAVHVCFGNYGGQTVQRGAWEALIPFLSALRADHLVLEFKRWGIEHAACLKDLPGGIGVGLGVVDIKDNRVETAEEIARDIERAGRLVGKGRVRYIHPDCGFWMLQRGVADRKIAALAKGRDLFEGRA